MKQCSKCKKIKDKKFFHNDKYTIDNLYSMCRSCKNKSTRLWRKNNNDKYNNHRRKLYRENHNYYINYKRKNRWKYKENIKKYSKKRYHSNPEKFKIQSKDTNIKLKIKLLKLMGGKCICCGLNNYWILGIDHKKPLIRKQREQTIILIRKLLKNKILIKDYQVMCFGCNLSKGTRDKCTLNHSLII